MRLRDVTMQDLPLYEATLTDPRMMSELGGPLRRKPLREKLRGIVDEVRSGDVWYSVIVPEDDPASGAGTVCIWSHDWNGEAISEIGWMVLPGFQGRGLATRAVDAILGRARAERRWGDIHAFPGVTNVPSNAICRKLSFEHRGELDFGYAGRTLRCNHWVLEDRAP
jgi:RimJ/RimL family protein N-acetyltransferase